MQERSEPLHHNRFNPRHWRWYTKVLTGILILLLVGFVIGLIRDARNPVPYSARRDITYPLYYPKQLPTGYTINRESFHQTDGVVIFSIDAPSGKNIAVSQQRLPIDLDVSARKNPAGFSAPDERTFGTPLGEAHQSLWGNKSVISLPTQDTWIILNVTGIEPKEAEAVSRSFRPL